MGAGQSRELDEEPLQSGIRISKALLDQLNGRVPPPPPRQRPAVSIVGVDTLQALRPPKPAAPSLDAEVAAAAAGDAGLARALQRSRRLGGLLLKAEDEELIRVGELADELLAREYHAPRRPSPCAEHAAACEACYRQAGGGGGGATLRCAATVRAYAECAQGAWAAVAAGA